MISMIKGGRKMIRFIDSFVLKGIQKVATKIEHRFAVDCFDVARMIMVSVLILLLIDYTFSSGLVNGVFIGVIALFLYALASAEIKSIKSKTLKTNRNPVEDHYVIRVLALVFFLWPPILSDYWLIYFSGITIIFIIYFISCTPAVVVRRVFVA